MLSLWTCSPCTSQNEPQLQHARHDPALQNFAGKHPDRFVAFFFNTYTLLGQSSNTSYGLLDHVSGKYRNTSPSVAFIPAASVLGATTFIISRHIKDSDFGWYHEMKIAAVRSLYCDLQCKASRAHGDVLVAVLLHETTEAIIGGHVELRGSSSHQEGIL